MYCIILILRENNKNGTKCFLTDRKKKISCTFIQKLSCQIDMILKLSEVIRRKTYRIREQSSNTADQGIFPETHKLLTERTASSVECISI